MKKQTAVEWLMEQITYDNGYGQKWISFYEDTDLNIYFQQAKAMEKEQIENAYFEGADACDVELEGDRYFLVKPCSVSGAALYYALTYGI